MFDFVECMNNPICLFDFVESMKFKSFHHVPCPNMCKKLAEVSKEEAAMRKLGTRLKQTYLQAAASALSGKNKEVSY